MENIQRKLEKDIARLSQTGAEARPRRWTLMLIRNDGRTLNIRGFKALLLCFAATVLLIAGTAFVLYVLYQNSLKEAEYLRKSLRVARSESKSLRHQREVLIARLAIARSLAVESSPPENAAEAQPSLGKTEETTPLSQPSLVVPDSHSVANKGAEESDNISSESRAGSQVGVEDLSVFFDASRKRLRIQFVIRKKDLSVESVSGRAYVVLKPEGADQNQWLPLPAVSLENGRPSVPNRGQFFSIARFKPINLERTDVNDPQRYRRATIFVFSSEGELIFQQESQISVKEGE
jgi:hypothetical protein